MKGEIKRTLTVTKNERKVILDFKETLEEVFRLDFEETPENLFEIMYAIYTMNSKAYIYNNTGTIEIEYQAD